LVGVGFMGVAGVALGVTPRRHEATLGRHRLEDVIPARIGPWSVATAAPLVLPEGNQPTDVYDQVYARAYAGANVPPMMLLVAYGAAQSGLMKVHRPEVCYASSGFSIRDDGPADLVATTGDMIPAKSFVAVREDRTEQVLYWTRISNTFPRDLASQRLVMLELGVGGVIPDGVLVRCSTFGSGRTTAQTLQLFVGHMIAAAGPAGRDLLLGAVRKGVPGGKASTL
jgi:EpsI family protein